MGTQEIIYELVKEPLDLARAEVEALTGSGRIFDHYLRVRTTQTYADRLAYAKNIFVVRFTASREDLIQRAKCVDWPESIAVRWVGDPVEGFIKSLPAGVDLNNPDERITCFSQEEIIVTKRLAIPKQHFERRRPHNLPAPHPAGTHPRLARAMVNLTGSKQEVLDPFCGAGGILIEAALMGLRPEGFDIDPAMLERTKTNLEHFGLEAYLEERDACTLEPTNYLVSDLPYGKTTKTKDVQVLYDQFFAVLAKRLRIRAVLGMPDFIEFHLPSALKVAREFVIYIHGSLSKRILVVEPTS